MIYGEQRAGSRKQLVKGSLRMLKVLMLTRKAIPSNPGGFGR